MKSEIIVKHGVIGEISKLIPCHRDSVRKSLSGKIYSRKADEIRQIAIDQFGGVEVPQLQEK